MPVFLSKVCIFFLLVEILQIIFINRKIDSNVVCISSLSLFSSIYKILTNKINFNDITYLRSLNFFKLEIFKLIFIISRSICHIQGEYRGVAIYIG